jgi:hypothetical protein
MMQRAAHATSHVYTHVVFGLGTSSQRPTSYRFSLLTPFVWRGASVQLSDDSITSLPIPKLQTNGLLFIWVINAKYKYCLDLFRKWGCVLCDRERWRACLRES